VEAVEALPAAHLRKTALVVMAEDWLVAQPRITPGYHQELRRAADRKPPGELHRQAAMAQGLPVDMDMAEVPQMAVQPGLCILPAATVEMVEMADGMAAAAAVPLQALTTIAAVVVPVTMAVAAVAVMEVPAVAVLRTLAV
jgi:hypothetical protein